MDGLQDLSVIRRTPRGSCTYRSFVVPGAHSLGLAVTHSVDAEDAIGYTMSVMMCSVGEVGREHALSEMMTAAALVESRNGWCAA